MKSALNKKKSSKPKGLPTRLATPFTIKCLSCGAYIYKNKRHNATREIALGKDYLGVESHRFHIKCTGCSKILSIKTDPKNGVYITEDGCVKVEEEPGIQEEAEDTSMKLKKESAMKDEINRLRMQANHVNSSTSAFGSKDKLEK
ncbi:mRNA splicing protein YJU2 [Encephalitozoon intestinalis ATCC 50506]|uniref:Uncharacterized protein n=1 Tax=Encephalitozoon intestinalis (strain ATCC 50506) TaxID=876142 RepID=E0S8J2_ENCIT|nr:mRNA splicing protein YJU2 [Encephalitozoon intestinalis ATCC 50506]ADM11986.1 hypothetical protein Eint_080500 [Encephalitozoon intestinalis ATCC 50506]UTX45772.1 DUF572 domain-containing protein [Encephalitozoon intestinalis]